MRILSTGASGFIGKYLWHQLDNTKNYKLHSLQSDLRKYNEVSTEVLDFEPDVIIHLAARTEVEVP